MEKMPFDPYDFFGYLASGLLIAAGMQIVLGFPQILGKDLKLMDTLFLLLGVYVAGQIAATPAKALLEDLIVDKLLGRPSVNLLREKRPLLSGALFPGFYKPLPKQVRMRLVEKSGNEGVSGKGEALFLHIRYCPRVLQNEKLMQRLDRFLSKYGFSRNLSFTSLATGSALLWKGMRTPTPYILSYGATSIFVGVMLFYRYLKFFRQYSYELFNVYAGD